MSRVMIIGDTHLPYELEGYLEFCQSVKKQYKCNRVIHIGDFIDHHALSFHDSEPMLKCVTADYESAHARPAAWHKPFPRAKLIPGNHDRPPARQRRKTAEELHRRHRLPADVERPPQAWDVQDSISIDGILYHHGETAGGVNGFRKDAETRMRCTVTGHNHSNFGVSYTATDQELVWGLAVGCGVDQRSLAFAYGKHFAKTPVIGCGVVIDGVPHAVPMDLGSKIRRVEV